jgi:hypothetical protein
MTADGGSTAPYSPGGGGSSLPHTPNAQMPPSSPPFPLGTGGGGRRGPSVLLAIGVVVAVLLSTAALIVALTRGDGSTSSITPTAGPQPSSQPTAADITAADKALCEAIAPLIRESREQKNAFVALGPTGSPERDAGIPEFVRKTQDWANRAQQVLDDHASPPRFFTRTLQRYIDDMRLYAASVRPGAATDADAATWTDSLVALGGPFEVCSDLGVQLW